MALSLDTYLRDLSYSYYLKNNSQEVQIIRSSIEDLYQNLNQDLGKVINQYFVFGSYDRNTNLPRSIDSKSDIDIMVIFNQSINERTPDTYRRWLKNFADKNYGHQYGSQVLKTFPTVTIKLDHINYDLVPAKQTDYQFSKNDIYIPDNDNGWRITDPYDVKKKLINANTRNNSIVKPIVRLMKAWNCSIGHPFDSYELEMDIIDMNFHNDNVQSGFFWAAEHLTIANTNVQKERVASLNYNLHKAEEALGFNDVNKSKLWLHRVLPKTKF